ncbi:MAG: YeeE/YedE thiosulfate transporter family protein [Verrucomicrobiales bacterium]|nr:YeeE/YedE thiosulfate transporter family protein [Verrucomicrobiales bacterium]
MIDFIMAPWPWWFSGIIIGLIVPLLYLLSGKGFGVSTSFQEVGALCARGTGPDYLKNFDWRAGLWTLVFAGGIILGGYLANSILSREPITFLPESFHSTGGMIKLLIGGFLVGFGTRYAGGCTSGHAINGIANLNLPSLIATIFFFVGGLAVTWGLGGLLF